MKHMRHNQMCNLAIILISTCDDVNPRQDHLMTSVVKAFTRGRNLVTCVVRIFRRSHTHAMSIYLYYVSERIAVIII